MRSSILLLILALVQLSTGCADSETETPAVNETERSEAGLETLTVTADEQKPNEAYQPILEKDLAQSIITNRMENNFKRYHNKIAASELTHFPSAGLSVYHPEGLKRAKKHSGFEARGATVFVLTNPFSMEGTTSSIIGEEVNSQRSGVLFTKTIEVDGMTGVFYASGEELASGAKIVHLTSAFGNDQFSWIIKGMLTPDGEEQFGEQILKSVLNARISDKPRLPPGEDVDFTIQPNRLELTDGFIDKVVFTKGGVFPLHSVLEPVFQASSMAFRISEKDRRDFSTTMISPSPAYKIELISTTTAVTIDGLDGFEHVAIGLDQVSEEPLQIYSTVLFGEKGGYVMHAWVSSQNPENYIPDFRSLARSFKRRTSGSEEEKDD